MGFGACVIRESKRKAGTGFRLLGDRGSIWKGRFGFAEWLIGSKYGTKIESLGFIA